MAKDNNQGNTNNLCDIDEDMRIVESKEHHYLSIEEIIAQYSDLFVESRTISFDKSSLVESLHAVQGQQDNIEVIVSEMNRWLRKAKKKKPLVFMFAGTSGTGKTFTAKCIHSSLQQDGFKFVRLNMNEYHNETGIHKLLGSEQGFVDSDKDAPLFAAHRASEGKLIVLFDEIEKAHPSLFTTIMSLMDEGIMANGKGENFNFKQSIIFFTTNLAQDQLISQKKRFVEQKTAITDRTFQEATKQILINAGLPSEVCGRVNWLLVYNTLNSTITARIAIEKIRELGREYDITINRVPQHYLEEVATKCKETSEGARPIETEVRNKFESLFQEIYENETTVSGLIYDINEEYRIVPSEADTLMNLDEISIIDIKTERFDKEQLISGLKAVRGQQDNIEIIAREIETWIKDVIKEAPLVFMFAGTSGTGKTFTAEIINESLKGYKMVKLNMNEYHSEADSWKLLGSSSGYVGSDKDSPIFAARRETPKLLILFDEIEKAHPSLFTTIMTLMEKGEMGNGHGETFDFKQSIIIFTTNLAMNDLLRLKRQSIMDGVDPSSQKFQDAAKGILKSAGLKDEISGRLNWLLVYNTLNASQVAQIAVSKIRNMGAKYGIAVNNVDKSFLQNVAYQCANNNEGARPVNRMVTSRLKPVFQDAYELGSFQPGVLYDINDQMQLVPSNENLLIPIDNFTIDIIDSNDIVANDKESVTIQLPSTSFFKSGYSYDSFRQAMGLIKLDNGSGTGSGFIISPDGYIITCAHCVEASTITFVRDDNKREYEAFVVYANHKIDIAILKINVTDAPYLLITDSLRPLKVGTDIILLGYPSGTDLSMDVSAFEGKISNVNKKRKSYITDAVAAPGSSGGALISKKSGVVHGILQGGYKETLGVDVNTCVDIRIMFEQDDINIDFN